MLILAGVDPDIKKSQKNKTLHAHEIEKSFQSKKIILSAPLTKGVLDLRNKLHASHEAVDTITTIGSFIVHYKKFFMSVIVLVGIFIGLVSYIGKGTEDRDTFTVTVDTEESSFESE
jgi:hypothetical protein